MAHLATTMLRHRLCTTSLKARKKRGAKGVPQSPALALVLKPKADAKAASHSGGCTEQSIIISCHSSPKTIWRSVAMLILNLENCKMSAGHDYDFHVFTFLFSFFLS